ncbi:MAG: hypothetical protein ACI9R3_005809 [Verrucomicrobiales bacterium]|jgi:hypothetical protein
MMKSAKSIWNLASSRMLFYIAISFLVPSIPSEVDEQISFFPMPALLGTIFLVAARVSYPIDRDFGKGVLFAFGVVDLAVFIILGWLLHERAMY